MNKSSHLIVNGRKGASNMKKKEKKICFICGVEMIEKEDFDICPKCGMIQYKMRLKHGKHR